MNLWKTYITSDIDQYVCSALDSCLKQRTGNSDLHCIDCLVVSCCISDTDVCNTLVLHYSLNVCKVKVDQSWDIDQVGNTLNTLLQHFVREQGVLTLEQGVHKLTQAPAQALRLAGKGVIAVGADADLCVFDPAALTERGTYQDPCQTALGMDAVLVAGRLAVKNGEMTGVKAGTLIRK